jgi:hypothetical protein
LDERRNQSYYCPAVSEPLAVNIHRRPKEKFMFVSKFTLILPRETTLERHALAAAPGEHGKLQVFRGTQAVKNYGITVQGSGVTAKGSIEGSLTTYDYKALYQTCKLTDNESANYWFVSYTNLVHMMNSRK